MAENNAIKSGSQIVDCADFLYASAKFHSG